MTADVELQVTCAAPGMPSKRDMAAWVNAAVDAAGGAPHRRVEVGVRVVDEAESRELNCRYRQKDRPTNVLAFPADAELPGGWPEDMPAPLGDLVICAPVVAREADAQDKAEGDHWAHMLVHGTLHLLGYDHEAAEEAEAMEAMEIRILEAGGLQNPYEDKYFS